MRTAEMEPPLIPPLYLELYLDLQVDQTEIYINLIHIFIIIITIMCHLLARIVWFK